MKTVGSISIIGVIFVLPVLLRGQIVAFFFFFCKDLKLKKKKTASPKTVGAVYLARGARELCLSGRGMQAQAVVVGSSSSRNPCAALAHAACRRTCQGALGCLS